MGWNKTIYTDKLFYLCTPYSQLNSLNETIKDY